MNTTLKEYRSTPTFLTATEIESLHSVSIEEHAEKNSILIRELVNIGKEFYKGKTTIALEAFDNLFADVPESSPFIRYPKIYLLQTMGSMRIPNARNTSRSS